MKKFKPVNKPILAGLIVLAATGLGEKLVNALSKALPGSYVWLVAGVVAASLCVAFIMPSAMGRVLLLLPVTLALADHFGFVPGSNGRTALVLAASLGTNVPAFTISLPRLWWPCRSPGSLWAGYSKPCWPSWH